MTFSPNFFIDREPWTIITFGSGAPIRAALVEINDVSTEDQWKKHKSKETSGELASFEGTTWSDPKLVFEGTDDRDFDDLRALWDLLAPVPGLTGGSGTATPAPGQTFAIGSPAKGSTGGSTGGSSSTSSTAGGATAAGGSNTSSTSTAEEKKDKKENVGPRPPTVPVTYPLLAWHGILAVARKKWEGPYPTDTNGLRVTLTLIADKPPRPAGTGAMKPADPGSQFVGGAGGNPGNAGGASGGNAGGSATPPVLNKSAAAGAAGT